MNPKKFLSAIVITRNEEARLPMCLEHLSWVDEIIVVDNGSTDSTPSIAKKYRAIMITEKTGDFSVLRNAGAKSSHGTWLLYVDADETVNPSLRDEILALIKDNPSDVAFFIPRQNYYMGHLWPAQDGMVRLIRKDALIGWKGIVHEHAQVEGTVGELHNYFIHDTHRGLAEMVAKTNEWSVVEAQLRLDHHHPPVSWWRLLRVMATAFFDSFVRQGGWRAGTVGWIESVYQAFSMFITYAKLWELQQKKS